MVPPCIMSCVAHLFFSLSPRYPTMLLSDLPPECLQLILKVLKDQGDRSSLSRMLQVNSFFCDAALPFLYDDAFLAQYSDNDHNASQKFGLIFRTILQQLPPEEVGPLLLAAFDVYPEPVKTAASVQTRTTPNGNEDSGQLRDDKESQMDLGQETSTTSTLPTLKRKIDYLSHFRVFCFEQVILNPLYRHVGSGIDRRRMNLNKSLEKLAFTSSTGKLANGRGEGTYDDMLVFPPIVDSKYFPASTLRYGAVSMAIRRQLTWLLCSRTFEQIRILTIPLSDVDQYLDMVERFPSLSSVTFKMDEFLDTMHLDKEGLTPEILQALEDGRNRREKQFRAMLCFVRRHGRLFPNVLMIAYCSDSRAWPTPTRCPKEIQDELEGLLPPLTKVTAINDFNSQRLTRRIKETNLGSVKQIALYRTAARLDVFMATDPTFWSRCRSLKSITVYAPGALCFRWAVDDKIARARGTAFVLENGAVEPERPIFPPAPVSKVIVRTYKGFKDELNDIAIGFGETLEFWRGTVSPKNRSATETDLHIGAGWILPKIETLSIDIDENTRLLMARDMFSGLGKGLKSLQLSDRSDYHRLRRVESCRLPSEAMPNLNNLVLCGWPALNFHSGILHLTPNLESLELRLSEMAPLEDLEILSQEYGATGTSLDLDVETGPRLSGRAPWTWDWYLPHLQILSLAHEFAFMFQFRMLVGCPSLTDLTLDISGINTTVKRDLTLQDFDISHVSVPSPSPCSMSPDRTRVVMAPSVTRLTMLGLWSLSDEIVQVLSETTCPNLSHLKMEEASGFSVQGWVSTLRRRPLLKVAACGRATKEEVQALGLIYRDGPSTEFREETPTELEDLKFYFFDDCWGFSKDEWQNGH